MGKRADTNKITYDLTGAYGVGYTAQGQKFLFDIEDYEKIKDYGWYFDQGYVAARVKGTNKKIKIHQVIMGKPTKGRHIDHIRDTAEGLDRKADNRKENLRFVTPAQNNRNRGMMSNNTSGHTGVYKEKKKQKWKAMVKKNGKSKSKTFPLDKYTEACKWQEKTVKKLHGKYAYVNCNIPPQTQQAEPGV